MTYPLPASPGSVVSFPLFQVTFVSPRSSALSHLPQFTMVPFSGMGLTNPQCQTASTAPPDSPFTFPLCPCPLRLICLGQAEGPQGLWFLVGFGRGLKEKRGVSSDYSLGSFLQGQ